MKLLCCNYLLCLLSFIYLQCHELYLAHSKHMKKKTKYFFKAQGQKFIEENIEKFQYIDIKMK